LCATKENLKKKKKKKKKLGVIGKKGVIAFARFIKKKKTKQNE